MIMTDCTTNAQPEPGLGRRGGPFDCITKYEFRGNGAALSSGYVSTVEAGGNQLIVRRLGQQIAGKLLHGKAVK